MRSSPPVRLVHWPPTTGFARIYNGPNYAKNNYDSTIRTWYEKFNGRASPDLMVRSAQVYLMYLGFEPSDIDDIFGNRTRSAMNEYQSRNHLPITDELDDTTFASIEANGRPFRGGSWRRAGNREQRGSCRKGDALEIRFYDMTVDGEVPVVGVTCIERTGRPCFSTSVLHPLSAQSLQRVKR
jgi:Putative peptidoglycan binding domain/N-acetylmuramidase